MKYMLLAYTNATAWDEQDISSDEVQAICQFYLDFERELTETGEWVGSEGLADPSHSKTVSKVGDQAVVTDGPFVDAKETLVSFAIVDCVSYERAVEIASRVVAFTGDTVEVRPVMDVSLDPEM